MKRDLEQVIDVHQGKMEKILFNIKFASFTRIFDSISKVHIEYNASWYMIPNLLHSSIARSLMMPIEEDVICLTLNDKLCTNSSNTIICEFIYCSVLPSKEDEGKHSSNAIESPRDIEGSWRGRGNTGGIWESPN